MNDCKTDIASTEISHCRLKFSEAADSESNMTTHLVQLHAFIAEQQMRQ